MVEWRKCVAKERRIILEGFQDHIVSNLQGRETPYAMWKALIDLFQNNSDHKKLALKDRLMKIKMEKGDTILKYMTKFTQCWDEIGTFIVIVSKDDVVRLALLCLTKRWHKYEGSVNGREKLPEWERLWSNLAQ